MGVLGTLYVTRLSKDSKTLLLSTWKPILRNGEYHRPALTSFGYDMDVPDFFPKIKAGDEPTPVKATECKEETGLWLTAEDNFFKNEYWLYNTKPTLKKNKEKKYYDYEDKISNWAIHLKNANTDLKSYEEIRNIKLIESGN